MRIRALALLAASGLIFAGPVFAVTIHVPGDYPTIQQAINAASSGDVIEVDPGTYHEALVMPAGLTLTSSGGASVTILDGDSANRVIDVTSGSPPVVEIVGFTIQNGFSSSNGAGIRMGSVAAIITDNLFLDDQTAAYGAAIYALSSNIRLERNKFHRCHASQGAGIYLKYGDGTIQDNEFKDGIGDVHCGGVYLYSSSPVINRNLFVNCTAGVHGGAVDIGVNSVPTITSNTFVGGSAVEGGCVRFGNESGVVIFTNNIVTGAAAGYGLYYPSAGAPPPYLDCNDVWENAPGDYYAITPGPHDISADPRFCDPVTGDYRLMNDSPCIPEAQPVCGLIGALPEGCGATSTAQTSWGKVKMIYRTDR